MQETLQRLNIEQRTDDWYSARAGKFTSSRIHDLMGIKGLGKTGETYAFEKAVEIVEGIDQEEGFTSFDTNRGIELEPYAFDKFAELKEMEFLTVSKCGFYELPQLSTGGSPDGLVSDNSVLEIKCPKPNKFFRLITDGLIDQCYIEQMQHQMFVTGAKQAYFFNYCIYNGIPKWHEIIVPRDEDRIKLMELRILQAVEIRDEFVQVLQDNIQYS